MKSLINRLRDTLTYSEIRCAALIMDETDGKNEAIIQASKIVEKEHFTRGIMVSALKLLEVSGVIESKSLGMKGTYIKILDKETLSELVG